MALTPPGLSREEWRLNELKPDPQCPRRDLYIYGLILRVTGR
jgi:hypothetical protein